MPHANNLEVIETRENEQDKDKSNKAVICHLSFFF